MVQVSNQKGRKWPKLRGSERCKLGEGCRL